MAPPRILYLLNISNPDRLSSDSGWIFADLLTPALADAGASVVVAAPAKAGDDRTGFEATQVPISKYRARFDPGMDSLVALIRDTGPDVVVANQVEAAPAIRAALLEASSPALLACYCHYLPFTLTDDGQLATDPSLDDRGLGRAVLLAFISGLAVSDRILAHSDTAASWISAATAGTGIRVDDKLRIVPAPRDERLVRDVADLAAPVVGEPVTGIYNHRLYAHYGTECFVRLARRLVFAQNSDVQLRVMDLFGSRSPERVALDDSPERLRAQLAAMPGTEVVSDGGDRSRYRSLLADSHFGIAPFRPGCPWSMSVIDCQGMGLPVIAPRMGWPAEHIDDELLFTTNDEAAALVERLSRDSEFYLVHAKRALASTESFAPDRIAARYLEALS